MIQLGDNRKFVFKFTVTILYACFFASAGDTPTNAVANYPHSTKCF